MYFKSQKGINYNLTIFIQFYPPSVEFPFSDKVFLILVSEMEVLTFKNSNYKLNVKSLNQILTLIQ